MSDMRHLLETVTKFAGEPAQKPGDQVRGEEPMPKKGGGKKHPYQGRLVGGESILRELEQQIVEGNVERRLREEFNSTFKSVADKIVSAGSATRDALSNVADTIPRPFDEKEVAKDIKQGQREQIRKDVKSVSGDYGKEQQRQTTPISPEQKAGIRQAVNDYNQLPKKQTVDEEQEVKLHIAEWGASGTAVGPGNDDADPVELAAQRAQQVAGKSEQHNQLMGLVAQVNSARSQLADLNKQFPQGANAAEKAYALQGLQSQRVQLGRQIEDLMTQVSALRSQA